MRWTALFDDLEAQLVAAERAGETEAVDERTRAERARVLLADRLRAAVDASVRLRLRDGTHVRGRVRDAGLTWVLVDEDGRECLVPLAAVSAVADLPPLAAPAAGPVARRLGTGHVLRALSRDRAVVDVVVDAVTYRGRIDAVGADHVDVALVRPDGDRPSGERQVVPTAALVLVRAVRPVG